MKNLSLATRAYILTVIFLGALALYVAWRLQHGMPNLWLLGIGCVAVASTAQMRVKLFRTFRSSKTGNVNEMAMSLAFIPTFLLLLSSGPLAGAIAGLFNMDPIYQKGIVWYRRPFNAAAIILPVMAAWAVLQPFHLAPGSWNVFQLIEQQRVDAMLIPLIGITIATAVYYIVNTGIVATVIAIISRQSPITVWRQQCLWMGPGYFAGASCATLILALLPNLASSKFTWLGLVIVTIPIPLVMYRLNKYHEQINEEKQSRIDVLSQQQAELEASYAALETSNAALEASNAALEASKENLQQLYTSTVESLALAIDAKDRYTKEHIQRVKGIAVALAGEMGIVGDDLKAIETGALLHDIGKIAVPEHILTKPGRLSDEEFAMIKSHPEKGARILEPVQFPFPVMPIVRHHHERWDGTGYPDGLAGENIPLGGRILAVADVYDALTSDRSYRRGWTHERAIDYLGEHAGAHFDPTIVDAFYRVVKNHPELFDVERPVIAAVGSAGRSVHEVVSSGGTSFEYLSLYEISQAISAAVNLDEMLTTLTGKIRHLFDASACAILLAETPPPPPDLSLTMNGSMTGPLSFPKHSAPQMLRVRRATGDYSGLLQNGHTVFGERITGRAAATGEGVVAPFDPNDLRGDVIASAAAASLGEQLQSIVVVPLIVDGVSIGTINVYQNRAYAFDPEALRVLQSIALQAGRAIKNAMEFDRTLESALTDELTGLHNARHMNQFLERALERARLETRPLSLLVLDLDNFKPVNDRFGHTWGNEVLRELGGLFQGALRSADLVARYAGDEFVIILTDTDATEAQGVIDNVRIAIRDYDPRPPGTTEETSPIEVSVGRATYPEDGGDAKTLIAVADRAMFRDKKQRKGESIRAEELAERSLKLVA